MNNNNVKIVLISPQQGVLDINKDTEVPFTFAVSDIRDISKKQGTFSKTIQLAGTKNNNILLNNYFDVNIQEGTFNINKLQKCQVLQNGVPIINEGILQLLNIKKVQNNILDEQLVEYEVLIKDSVSDLFTKINNLELTDIEFGDLDHIFNADNIISTLNNTWVDGYKYFFTNIDSNIYNLNQFKPAIFAKTYFDRIFENAGFIYQWDTLTASTVQFDKLIIPYNGDAIKFNQNFDVVEAIKTGDTTYSAFTVADNFEIEVVDNTDKFNPSTGVYTNPFYIADGSTLNFELLIEYEIVLKNYENNTVHLVSNFTNSGVKYVPKVQLKRNALVIPIASVNIAETENEYIVNQGTTISALGEINFGTFTRFVTVGTNNGFPNDTFKLELGFPGSTALGSQFAVQISSAQPARWRNGPLESNTAADVYPQLRVKNINLVIRPGINNISFNSILRMNDVIPLKIKQSDFLKSILTMYNLYVTIDDEQPNKLILEHRDEYYDSGEEIDWSEKLAKDSEQTLSLLPDVASKKLILTYKQDDNDITLKGYRDSVKEIYGQLEYIFESEYVRGIETKELIFSPITVGRDSYNNILPQINNIAPKTNIKIGLNPYQYSSTTTLTIFNYLSTTITGTSASTVTVPLISHFNDRFDPTFDINFGVNDYYFYNIGQITNNNLFNLFWRRTINQINNGKLLTALFNLNENDINNLKLNHKIFCNNSWWYINKIIDYKANKNELTKVELISTENELKFAPFIVREPNVLSGGDTDIGIIRDYIRSYNKDTNVVIGNSLVTIEGKNNFVNGNVKNTMVYGDNNLVSTPNSFVVGNNNDVQNNSFVIGSNNTISGESSNIFIVGDGITATTSDTLYVPNIVTPSGGTINGYPIDNISLWALGTGLQSTIRDNGTSNTASGDYGYAEGFQTTAAGEASHAEGSLTTAGADYSHAEGLSTLTSNLAAHAEGNGTQANGDASHSEGFLTEANGNYSHAEGSSTEANGIASHSEGNQTVANGDYSHAGGFNVNAENYNEWTRGHTITGNLSAQYGLITLSRQTTNATSTELFLDGATATERYVLPVGSAYLFKCYIVARSATGDISTWEGIYAVKNDGGTTSVVGTPTVTMIAQDAALATTAVTLSADNTNDSILITVNGLVGTTLQWSATILYSSIQPNI